VRLRAVLLAAFALTSAVPAAAQTQESEAAFTQRLAERLRAALPGREIRIAGEFEIRVAQRTGDPAQVFVGRIWNFCRTATAEECETSTARLIQGVVGVSTREEEPVTRAQLRVAVRARIYCSEITRLGAGNTPAQRVIMRDMAPDLCQVAMVDYPDRMRGLAVGDLTALGLTEEAAWQLAETQTVAALPQPVTFGQFEQGIVAVTGFDYIPSLLLNRDGWRALAAAQGGLIVAVPADNMMIVARAATVTDLAGFRRATREAFDTAERQISDSVYRWTEQGWVLVE
jgi:hypothetical protein